MDSQSYLNEISSTVRPAKKPRNNLLSNKFVLVGAICLIGVILMAIIGNVLSNGRAGIKEQAISLKLRLDSTSGTISSYQTNIKSSDLRSSSTSLNGVISNTNRDLTDYLTEKYKFKSAEKKVQESENKRKEDLEAELFQAKINGILDRIYAHKISYEITMIQSMESKLYDSVSDENLKSILKTSYDSLTNLQGKFANFSETN